MDKKLMILLIGFISLSCLQGCLQPTKNIEGKKILIIIAPNNFNYEEFSTVKNVLQSAGAKIIVASKTGESIGDNGEKVIVDVNLSAVGITIEREWLNLTNYEAFIFIGGKGAKTFFDEEVDEADKIVSSIVKFGFENKLIAAIGTAPPIITNSLPQPFLENLSMTCHPSQKENLTGVNYVGEGVVICESVITATDERYSTEFANKIVEALQ